MKLLRGRQQDVEPDLDADTAAPVAQVTAPIAPGQRTRLGDVLVSENLVTPDQLSASLNLQQESGRQLGAILVEQGLLDQRVLTQALARQLGLPTIDLRIERPSDEALAAVPEEMARRHEIVPMRLVDGVLDVAIADGNDPAVREALAGLPVREVNIHLAPPQDVHFSLNTHYRVLSSVDDQVQQFWAAAAPVIEQVEISGGDAPIIQLVNKIVAQALRDRASDIHVEPTDGRLRVRYRVDGALREVLSLPSSAGPELVSRIKILAEMDIVERRRPQDGQFHINVDGVPLDVRVATASTIWGETAVLRLLDKRRAIQRLSDLGMPGDTFDRYLSIVHKPYGMIICSGPTGSGKTTTLYATLVEISRSELNVMTIEDPVEYVFPSVNQMQINQQAEVTFATGLKSILRQDPDVILVGEIRDQETARIAVQSALTGHLVMSSLHATDATSALYRLVDMGSSRSSSPRRSSASSVSASCGASATPAPRPTSRRRRNCAGTTTSADPRRTTSSVAPVQLLCRHGIPRPARRGRGARGDRGDRPPARERCLPHEIRQLAMQQGMRTMGQEAMAAVASGVTTIDEVIRNVYLS
ncbi:MAG: GspE/PulE family protein [Ilumatobacteraceae bacterium]